MARLALLTDLHHRSDHESAILDELRWVADHLETAFQPDHTFILGDLLQHESAATDRRHLRQIHEILTDRSFPVTYLLGNHDAENLDREEIGAILDQETFWGETTVCDVPVIYLDSSWASVQGARGILGGPQLQWVGGPLGRSEDALVLVHHPVGYFDLSNNPWFSTFPERAFFGDRMELLGLIRDVGDVRATISGHIHETRETEFWDLPHVSLNAFSREDPDTPLTGTYTELTAEPDQLRFAVKVREETVQTFELP